MGGGYRSYRASSRTKVIVYEDLIPLTILLSAALF